MSDDVVRLRRDDYELTLDSPRLSSLRRNITKGAKRCSPSSPAEASFEDVSIESDGLSEASSSSVALSHRSSNASLLCRRTSRRPSLQLSPLERLENEKDSQPTYKEALIALGFVFTGVLGRGHNSGILVLRGRMKGLSHRLAVKGTDEAEKEGTLVASIRKEFEMLRSLSHPNIVKALWLEKECTGICFVMEECRGERLGTLMAWDERLDLARREAVVEQILLALVYLQEKNIVHRDLHCSNVLVDIGQERSMTMDSSFSLNSEDEDSVSMPGETFHRGSPCVKIVDFGSAVQFSPRTVSMTSFVDLACDFNSEIVPPGLESNPCDLFAVGLLLTGLMTGSSVTTKDVYRIKGSAITLKIPKVGCKGFTLSAEASAYISTLLSLSSMQRPRADVALKELPRGLWLIGLVSL